MKHAIIIAAVFILATIAVAVVSPFDHPPPQRTLEPVPAAQAPSDDGSSDAEPPSN